MLFINFLIYCYEIFHDYFLYFIIEHHSLTPALISSIDTIACYVSKKFWPSKLVYKICQDYKDIWYILLLLLARFFCCYTYHGNSKSRVEDPDLDSTYKKPRIRILSSENRIRFNKIHPFFPKKSIWFDLFILYFNFSQQILKENINFRWILDSDSYLEVCRRLYDTIRLLT